MIDLRIGVKRAKFQTETLPCGSNAQLIREHIEPLPFDAALESNYLAALRSDWKKIAVLDELESLYEDITNFKERRYLLEASMSEHLCHKEEVEDHDTEEFEIDDSEDGDGS